MDEPLSNLDALLRVSMRAEIKELHQELGTTTLYVTHDQVEALSLGTRIVVMREANLEQIGTPTTIYHQPATRFVGQFVGSPSMNFINVKVDKRNDECWVINEGVSLQLPPDKAVDLQDVPSDTEIVMGIRPEHISVSKGNGDHGIQGVVHIVEPLGKDHYLHVQIDDGLIIVRTDPDEPYEVGDRIQLMPYYRHVSFFNLQNGDRIWKENI
jgi:multiple sugar transport system ATP-binding protein